ncbi:MAG TPA: NlpC/P60 family protein [Steroidobacteraceae bacterium]|nr:NlpC/P60 family protein [Steroidobacteraceae bacterium]
MHRRRLVDLVGIPYVEGGRLEHSGLDCLGLVLLGLQELGVRAEDPFAAATLRWNHGIRDVEQLFPDEFRQVSIDRPRLGEVVMFRSRTAPAHVMLVAEDLYVLNTDREKGSHLLRWADVRPHVVSMWRHADL